MWQIFFYRLFLSCIYLLIDSVGQKYRDMYDELMPCFLAHVYSVLETVPWSLFLKSDKNTCAQILDYKLTVRKNGHLELVLWSQHEIVLSCNLNMVMMYLSYSFGMCHDSCAVMYKMVEQINSLWPSDAIWRQRSGSTLAQVMACCLTAPSHYLHQCWLIINEVQVTFI